MQTKGGVMDLLREMFRHHAWATLRLIDCCMGVPPESLHEVVPGTARPILNMLTHVVGTDQYYLEALTGEPAAFPIRQGEVLSLTDIRRRFEMQPRRWEAVLDRIEELDVTLPADGSWPETHQAQNLLVLQAIHHGTDHRTQICTTLSLLGLEPPNIDGWSYWAATHHTGT